MHNNFEKNDFGSRRSVSMIARICAISQWRRQFKFVVQQQSNYVEHLMQKLQDVTDTLDN